MSWTVYLNSLEFDYDKECGFGYLERNFSALAVYIDDLQHIQNPNEYDMKCLAEAKQVQEFFEIFENVSNRLKCHDFSNSYCTLVGKDGENYE